MITPQLLQAELDENNRPLQQEQVVPIAMKCIGGLQKFRIPFKNLSEHAESAFMAAVIRQFYLILPNFSNFYLRNQLIHNDPYVPQGVLKLFTYAVLYSAFGILLAYLLFRKRDL